jgi:adenosylcobinamide-phosphate synthase
MILPLVAGYAADLLIGDPTDWPHPVRAFGYAIRNGTRRLNKDRGRFVKGMLLTIVLCGLAWSIPWYVLHLAARAWLPGYYVLATAAVFFCLAGKNLLDEGQAVFDTLDREGLDAGRRRLTRIVGRETANLSEQQVRIAVLESMSENLSDGVIAPLVFYLIGGVPAMLLYKMINTLDSMIGYNRDPYRLFGRFAARLDDVANFLPARLTAWLMVVVTASPRGARFIFRYGRAHTSPNAGYPEAALAGILNCRFGGPNVYHGITVIKPNLGDNDRQVTGRDFARVRYINHAVTMICVLLLLSVFAH